MSYLSDNIEALRRKDSALVYKIRSSGEVHSYLSPAPPLPNLRLKDITGKELFVYNPDNPLEECKLQLNMIEKEGGEQSVIFIGMGLGYGPMSVLREKLRIHQLIICEPSVEIFQMAMAASDLRPLILSDKVFFFIGEPDWEAFRRRVTLSAGDKIHLMNLSPLFHWRPDLYIPINQKAYETANQISVVSATNANNTQIATQNMFHNLTLAAHASSVECLKGAFKNRPALLISAGPSLTESLPEIKKAAGRCVMIAVDSALKPLMEAGISPDFVTTLDFREVNFEKLAPFIGNGNPTYAIVFEISACPMIPKRIPARHLFYAFQNNQSQEWVRHGLGVTSTVTDSMTVAHLSLGLALLIEASPIIFVGQDLSYTSDKTSHAVGSVFSSEGVFPENHIVPVTGITGEPLRTHRGFLAFKTGFETAIRTHPGTYINASKRGAHIKETIVLSLDTVLARYLTETLSPGEIIAYATMKKSQDRDGEKLLHACEGMAEKIGKKIKWVNETYEQVKKIQAKIQAEEGRLASVFCPDQLPPDINQEVMTLNSLKIHSDRMACINGLFYGAALEIDRRVVLNKQIMEKNYVEGVRDMLDIMLFENETHLTLLKEYEKRVSALSTYLEKEIGYKRGGENQGRLPDLLALYVESGDYLLVEEIFSTMRVAGMEFSPRSLFLLGISRFERLQFDEGERLFQQAAAQSPSLGDEVIAYKDRAAEALLKNIRGRFGPVKEWLRRFRAISRGRAWANAKIQEIWGGDGVQLQTNIEKSSFRKAELLLDWWSPYGDLFPEWFYLNALLDGRTGKRSKALEHLKKAVSGKPEEDSWHALLARWLLEKGAFDDGINHLKEAVRLNPKNALLWIEIGDVLFESGDFQAALIAYENGFLALPAQGDGLRKMGDCYLKMKEPLAAIAAYEAVLKRNGDDMEARENLKTAREFL